MERGQHAQSRKKRVQLNESFARLREAVIALGHDPDALGTQALIMRAALALLRDHIAVLLHVISPDDVNIALDHDRKRRGKKKDEGTNEPTSPEPLKPPSPAASMPTSGPDSKVLLPPISYCNILFLFIYLFINNLLSFNGRFGRAGASRPPCTAYIFS